MITVDQIVRTTLLKVERKGFLAQLFCFHGKPVLVRGLRPAERKVTGKVSLIQCGKCGMPHLSDTLPQNKQIHNAL